MNVLIVYSEVESRIDAFRKMLYDKLMMMPSSPDEQKKLIRWVFNPLTPTVALWVQLGWASECPDVKLQMTA